MNETKHDTTLLFLLRLAAFLCFAGWTWIHFYWEGPYGVLLWQDSTYQLAHTLGLDWEEFVGSGANDGLVQRGVAAVGWLYLLCTLLTLTVKRTSRWQMISLAAGSGLLVVLSYAKYLSAQRQVPMFVEHGSQMLIPLILVLALRLGVNHRLTVGSAMIAFVMTFAGHGSYAIGWWPTPGNFFAMTSVILHVEYPTAKAILQVAGVLDFLVCIGIFIPKLRRPCVLYGVVWGFLTAIARPVAGMSWSLNYWGADQFLQEAVVRAPHFLVPLFLYLVWRNQDMSTTVSFKPLPSPHNFQPTSVQPAPRPTL